MLVSLNQKVVKIEILFHDMISCFQCYLLFQRPLFFDTFSQFITAFNTLPKMSSLYHENCSSISKMSIGCKWMYENILRFWLRWLFVYLFSVMQSKCNWQRNKKCPKSRVKLVHKYGKRIGYWPGIWKTFLTFSCLQHKYFCRNLNRIRFHALDWMCAAIQSQP